jgi:hypothetical protein
LLVSGTTWKLVFGGHRSGILPMSCMPERRGGQAGDVIDLTGEKDVDDPDGDRTPVHASLGFLGWRQSHWMKTVICKTTRRWANGRHPYFCDNGYFHREQPATQQQPASWQQFTQSAPVEKVSRSALLCNTKVPRTRTKFVDEGKLVFYTKDAGRGAWMAASISSLTSPNLSAHPVHLVCRILFQPVAVIVQVE